MVKAASAAIIAFHFLAAFAGGQERPGTMSLNGVWLFALAPDASAAERLAHFYEASFDSTAFRPIPVPSNWSLQGFEEPIYGRPKQAGEGFYLYRFSPPQSFAGKRALLHFDGVWSSAEVWLNARPLGRHDSGFTAFAFDVSKILRAGAEDTLAVRVRQMTKDSLFDTNDDWSLGGIYRDVWLEGMPPECYIDRVETSTAFDAQYRNADLNARILVTQPKNAPNGATDYALHTLLTGPDGHEVQRAELHVPAHPGNGQDTLLKMHVRAPAHWTAETPSLYRLRVDLVVGGEVTHSRAHTLGFREISTAGGVLRINGQAVKLRGVNRHDEHPDVGRATRREHWLEDLRLMKDANINMVRTSHYPPAEGFIQLCDEMGMYVIDEVPMGVGGDEADDPSLASATLLRAYETIARDRNHPSVIVWSIGNENPFTALHLAAIRLVKGSDPTRPVLMPWSAEEWLPPEIDILAPHYLSAAAYDALAAHSRRPVVTTEFTHALGEEGFGGLADKWLALTRHPAGAGGAIWMWQDQGLKRTRRTATGNETYYQFDPRGIDGIVRADRSPQRDYWETKAVYAPVALPVERLAPTPGQPTIAVPVRNDFDFTDLGAVAIRWKLMADGRELSAGETRVHGAPHTTVLFELPLKAIQRIEPGVAYYVHVAFYRPDGSELTRRAIELVYEVPVPVRLVPVRVKTGRTLTITAGEAAYEFDPATAQLVSASARGRRLLSGARLTLWRPLNDAEVGAWKRAKAEVPRDLDRYTTTIGRWNVRQESSGITIQAEADHRVDESNSFLANYRYSVGPDGALRVEYVIHPQLRTRFVPEAGMELQVDASLDTLRWLGLGPLDTYPNMRAAGIFGLWTAPAAADTARGLKAGVRWVELSGHAHEAVRLAGASYVRLDAPGRLRVLAAVMGRPEKNRLPDPEYRLDIAPSTVFGGDLRITVDGSR